VAELPGAALPPGELRPDRIRRWPDAHGFRLTMVTLAVVAAGASGLAYAAGADVRSLPHD
jgi:hypothetical protein